MGNTAITYFILLFLFSGILRADQGKYASLKIFSGSYRSSCLLVFDTSKSDLQSTSSNATLCAIWYHTYNLKSDILRVILLVKLQAEMLQGVFHVFKILEMVTNCGKHHNSVRMWKNTEQKNSEFGQFLRSLARRFFPKISKTFLGTQSFS